VGCGCSFRRLAREDEHIALAQAHPGTLAGRELDDRPRAPAPRHSPGPQVGRDAENAVVRVQEDRVDGEAHEPHVNGRSGAKEDAFAPLEPGTSEETSKPGERRLREETPLTDQAAVLSL
jgi:hypothetical protein